MKLYLAGPDVFFPNAVELGKHKKTLCEKFGFTGLFPLDNEIKGEGSLSKLIYESNLQMIRDCDAIVANLIPFRGSGADAGTSWELGAATALRKKIYAYSYVDSSQYNLISRVEIDRNVDDSYFDKDGLLIENFGLYDNLMLIECLDQPIVVVKDEAPGLKAFEAVLEMIKDQNK